MSSVPLAIKPIYQTSEINQEITLHLGVIEVTDQRGTFPGHGVIKQQWLPEPRVWLEGRYETREMMEKPSAKIALSPNGKRFDITVHSMGLGIEGAKIWGTLAGLPNGLNKATSQTMKSLVFHLPNFSYYEGSAIRDDKDERPPWHGRATLSLEEWNITIDSIDRYNLKAEDDLEKSSGSAITHVGLVERKSNSMFSLAEVEEVLSALYLYLSFYRGSWVAPMLSVGLGEHGEKVFDDWRQWNIRKCERVQTWANRQSSESLELPFPGFYARLQSAVWSDPIRRSIAWYIECNRRASGLEASIILVQTVLELLGWAILVEDGKTLSSKGFDDLPAADKIRLVLSSSGIPREIPPYLFALKQLAGQFTWSDGPDSLVGMRNALVHPQLKNRIKLEQMSSVAIYEVWSLGVRYLDLIFLRLFNYPGKYLNRLKRECSYEEALEAVPWTGSSPAI